MRNTNVYSGIALLAMILFVLTSCEKENEGDTVIDYENTWIREYTENYGTDSVIIRITLTLTESTFETIGAIITEEVLSPKYGVRGNLFVSGNRLTVIATSLGCANTAGGLDWIDDENVVWDALLIQEEINETTTATYNVVGNTLTITPTDEEAQIYTKHSITIPVKVL